MPKSRKRNSSFVGRKAERRLREKDAYMQATQVRILAERLPNQEALKTCLMQESDPERRRKLFDFMKPFLKFANPEFPSALDIESRIIRP